MADQKLETLRHSCEHVLHQAVGDLFPGIKRAMGPATEEGFYFDFDPSAGSGQAPSAGSGQAPSAGSGQAPSKSSGRVPSAGSGQALSADSTSSPQTGSGQTYKITEADFPKIEKRMQEIIDADLPISRQEISIEEARKLFKDNPYKQDWLDLIHEKGEKVTVYWTGEPGKKGSDADLCRGPHVASTGKIGAFKLLSVAGAYWHGDEKNKMLTRIYGTAFPTREELEAYLKRLEEAKTRDHRVLGRDLGLFVFSDLVGKGLPLFTEKGSAIRRELERYAVDEEIRRGYKHVYTPDIAKVALFKKSGHYPYYKDSMYPVMNVDEEELILRPMTCPHHFQLYTSRPRSYRELPIRYAELAKQFRYEKSGELTGLMRVRLFCLADAHIIARKDQAFAEINGALDLIEYAAADLGLKIGEDFRYRLSLGDRGDEKKFYKDDEAWEFAEDVLRQVLTKRKAPFFEVKGEAAFYGPKIDIQMKNILGVENTAFTVQYDFVMPKRFDLKYIDESNQEKEAIVIHRSSIGAIERVMAFLIEKHSGAFPVWLSPVQVKVVPISEKSGEYARSVTDRLIEAKIRVELDDRDERMQAKIRDAEKEKVPYMLVVGPKEAESKSVSVRVRGEKDLGPMNLEAFLELVKADIAEKRQV